MTQTALILCATLLLVGCATRHADTAQGRQAETAERQQTSADALANDYVDCISNINDSTAVEKYAGSNTRRDAVMESCREEATRFTIVQEQAYDNACRAAGHNSAQCDSQAVSKAKRDTDKLLQEARQHIDKTSGVRRTYPE
jgi:hypothetical protein